MRVGLNATCIGSRSSGARQRFVGLYRELLRIMPDDEFFVYDPSDFRVSDLLGGAPNLSVVQTKLPSADAAVRLLRGLSYWHHESRERDFDILETFHLPLMKISARRRFLTIHDIRYIRNSAPFKWRNLFWLATFYSISNSNLVFTVSKSMREELLEFFPKANVSVLYNGVDLNSYISTSPGEVAALKRHRRLSGAYALAVGHLEERKNYLNLIKAFSILRRRSMELHLVIVGRDSGQQVSILKLVERLGLTRQVIILSDVSDVELRALYSGAAVFVFPSLYEGFGIPILEAMASRCPLALSNLPVFREIAGSAALYFDQGCQDSIADAIEAQLLSPASSSRGVSEGFRRVKDFDFQAIAGQLRDVYRSC